MDVVRGNVGITRSEGVLYALLDGKEDLGRRFGELTKEVVLLEHRMQANRVSEMLEGALPETAPEVELAEVVTVVEISRFDLDRLDPGRLAQPILGCQRLEVSRQPG